MLVCADSHVLGKRYCDVVCCSFFGEVLCYARGLSVCMCCCDDCYVVGKRDIAMLCGVVVVL